MQKPFSQSYRKELLKISQSLKYWRDNHIIYGDLRPAEDHSISLLLNKISRKLGKDFENRQNWNRLKHIPQYKR